jgi:hypothetical protein
VGFKTHWALGGELVLEARRQGVPHGRARGDEDVGKVHALADHLHAYGQAYVFEVATNRSVWDEAPRFERPS